LKFRPIQRIRRHADFQGVYANGLRIPGRYYTLFSKPNGLAVGRLGIAATKKLGGAVVRNRAKRLIREVFRRNDIAPGFDIVVVPRRELLSTSLTTIEAEYRASITRRVLKSR
jgi:ribonuclease P protein component